jgi:DNA-binding NarL/FixJ family response regulator
MKKTQQIILIVDDNRSFVERVIRMLEEVEDIDLNVATNYDEALKFLVHNSPDLILLDISLKGKSGIELLNKIRRMGFTCKIVMVSNHADDFYRKECKNLGADCFIDKTNDFALLPAIIENIQHKQAC